MPSFLELSIERFWGARFFWRIYQRWVLHDCSILAAALAFFGWLSVFPLALAGVTVLAQLLAGQPELLKQFTRFLAEFFPGATGENLAREIERATRSIALQTSVSFASLLAFASLLWSGRAYFDVLASVLGKIFPGAMPRSFLGHQLTLWSLMLGTGLLFIVSSAATLALGLAQTLAGRLPDFFLNRAPVFFDFAGKFTAFALTLLMFYLLYRWAPNRTIPTGKRVVWAGALVATLGWELGKWAFARSLGNITRFEATYGSVAGVVLTMLWIYYASMIVLFGAQFGATLEEMRNEKIKAMKTA